MKFQNKVFLRRLRSAKAVIGAFSMPVAFVLIFAATLVTAFHNPQPNNMPLTLAGPAASTSQIAAGIESRSPGFFDISATLDVDTVEKSVAQRDTAGAIAIGGTSSSPTVTIYIASGGGRGPAGTVESVGEQIARQLNTSATVIETAPVADQDPLGSGLFSVVIYTTLGGFLALVVLTQLAPRTRLRVKFGVAALAAVTVPGAVFGLSSIFLDGFDIGFDQLVSVLGVLGLYTFTVGLVVIVFEQLLKSAALLAVVPIVIFINLAGSGGGASASMLPDFWQWVHSFWFGSGAMESLIDIVYLPDADPTRWIVQILVWTLVLLVASMMIEGKRYIDHLHRQLAMRDQTLGITVDGSETTTVADDRRSLSSSPT